jgi:hypothetical protein
MYVFSIRAPTRIQSMLVSAQPKSWQGRGLIGVPTWELWKFWLGNCTSAYQAIQTPIFIFINDLFNYWEPHVPLSSILNHLVQYHQRNPGQWIRPKYLAWFQVLNILINSQLAYNRVRLALSLERSIKWKKIFFTILGFRIKWHSLCSSTLFIEWRIHNLNDVSLFRSQMNAISWNTMGVHCIILHDSDITHRIQD